MGKPHETTNTRGACYANKWAETAVSNELAIIADMPQSNINRPAHPFYVSLLKIASIAKGGYLPEHEALNAIKKTCAPMTWIPQREIDYQWSRAYSKSEPRHPDDHQNMLPKETAVSECLWKYDIANDCVELIREVPARTVAKAEQLANVFSHMLETGEIDITGLTVIGSEICPNGVTVKIQFASYSQALADCVFIACSRLNGFIWSEKRNGFFSIYLPTVNP